MMMRNLFSSFIVAFSSHPSFFRHTHTDLYLCFVYILGGVLSCFWIYVMGLLSVDDDIEMKEGAMGVQLNDNSRDARNNMMIEKVGIKGFDLEPELDFWPIQHPTEPSHEDRPVQCPMPHCSHLIGDERMKDDRFSERKRPEAKTILYKEHNARKAIELPVRMVRKRHHDHTNTIIPLRQTPAADPHLYQKDGCNHLQ